MDPLLKLQQVAEAATPGPWSVPDQNENTDDLIRGAGGERLAGGCCCVGFSRPADEAFVATFNPETVLDLLAVARAISAALPELPSREAWRTVMGTENADSLFDALAALRQSVS